MYFFFSILVEFSRKINIYDCYNNKKKKKIEHRIEKVCIQFSNIIIEF